MAVRWASVTTATLYIVTLVVAGGSVAAYGAVAVRQPAQPAFMFLVVPLCSRVLMVIAVGIVAFVAGRNR